jgi:hypothetical protein
VKGYGPSILLIAGTYGLATVATQRWMVSLLLFLQVGAVWYTLRVSGARAGVRRCAGAVFALALLAGLGNLVSSLGPLVGGTFVAATALYVVAPVSVTGDLARRRDAGRQMMFGALAAYLMLGMAFAFAYRCLAFVGAGPFFGSAGDGTLADCLFFSFVTLTTTGYGNLVPAAATGQTLAVLEGLLGQLFLVTVVAKIVSVWPLREPKVPPPPP